MATRIAIAARPNSGDWLELAELAGTTLDSADTVIGFRGPGLRFGLAGDAKPLAGLERVFDRKRIGPAQGAEAYPITPGDTDQRLT